ncbi:hypothetical protein MRB53_013679 [Persea americana]|uniref:Uncharacterized protein n=1 Tax=Persea americana TaxID=3435 RepID=A0ACC2K8Y2_PERAE|nr:hypothetical protein MRB53_013679 [Persea americana]
MEVGPTVTKEEGRISPRRRVLRGRTVSPRVIAGFRYRTRQFHELRRRLSGRHGGERCAEDSGCLGLEESANEGMDTVPGVMVVPRDKLRDEDRALHFH